VTKWGSTRTVWLVGRCAIKRPALVEWRLFLLGLLANMQESRFAATKHPKLCPVLWSVPGGFLLVMRRAKPLSRGEFDRFSQTVDDWINDDDMTIPVETKLDSFGWLNGRVVAIDYGS
jgi:hypothetical protein